MCEQWPNDKSYWKSIENHLVDGMRAHIEYLCDEEATQVRARAFEQSVDLLVGDPCYDQDHRGDWASAEITACSSDEDLLAVAEYLVGSLQEEIASDGRLIEMVCPRCDRMSLKTPEWPRGRCTFCAWIGTWTQDEEWNEDTIPFSDCPPEVDAAVDAMADARRGQGVTIMTGGRLLSDDIVPSGGGSFHYRDFGTSVIEDDEPDLDQEP